MAKNLGKLESYELENGNWENYTIRSGIYSLVNGTKEEHKLSMLISIIGDAGYDFMVNLCNPRKPKNSTYAEVVKAMSYQLQTAQSFLWKLFKFRQCRRGQSITISIAELKARLSHTGAKTELRQRYSDIILFRRYTVIPSFEQIL